METQTTIKAIRAWEVGRYRLTDRFSGSFLCDVGRELIADELKDLNRALATGIYLNRGPEDLLFHHETILVQIGLDQTKKILLVQLERGGDPLNLAGLARLADTY
jgi:hypothetical protein